MSEQAPPTPAPEASGWHKMEEAVVAARAGAEAAQAAMDFKEEKQAGIEARASSQEVRELNDVAEVAVYGTQGRTAGYLDKTGEPLKYPLTGKIESIRQSPRHGTIEAERVPKANAQANAYKHAVERLVDEGFELTQAKLIMDKREERKTKVEQEKVLLGRVTSQFTKNGMTETEAEEAAKKRLASRTTNWRKEDDELKRFVREEGIFTAEEYDKITGTGDTDDPTAVLDPTSPGGLSERQLEILQVSAQLDNARIDYARLSAGRGSRTIRFGKEFSKEAVAAARERYEGQKAEFIRYHIAQNREAALNAGIDENAFNTAAVNASAGFSLGEAQALARSVYDERMIASGKRERGKEVLDQGRWRPLEEVAQEREIIPRTGDAEFDRDQHADDVRQVIRVPEGVSLRNRLKGTFLKWWGEETGTKFFSKTTLKRAGLAAGATVAVAGAAGGAAAGGVLFPPIALGGIFAGVAGKTVHGLMDFGGSHSRKEKRNFRYNDELGLQIQEALNRENITEQIRAFDELGDTVDEHTSLEVRRNRQRLAATIGGTALGGVVGVAAGFSPAVTPHGPVLHSIELP